MKYLQTPPPPPDFWTPYREEEGYEEIQDSTDEADEDDELPFWYFPECENRTDSSHYGLSQPTILIWTAWNSLNCVLQRWGGKMK